MKILVIGGTRYFGIHMVNALLDAGHDVSIATRGITADSFGDNVKRIIFDRSDSESMKTVFSGTHYDVVIDKIAYCSNDIKNAMNALDCDRYIYMSSTAVYGAKTMDTKEEDYNGADKNLIWCSRTDFSYSEVKRQAENALYQRYVDRNWTAVRYPVVLGKDDYTKRLLFYVEHTMKSLPMHIDNLECQMGFIRSDEAGKFLAFLVDQNFSSAINGRSYGTISIKEIIQYVEAKTNSKAIITPNGEPAPFNGECEYSINTEKAESQGFLFSHLKDWIFELLDDYINLVDAD